VPDPEGIITGGHDNKTAAPLLSSGRKDQHPRAQDDVQKIIANNRPAAGES